MITLFAYCNLMFKTRSFDEKKIILGIKFFVILTTNMRPDDRTKTIIHRKFYIKTFFS